MKQTTILFVFTALLFVGCVQKKEKDNEVMKNPFFSEYSTQFEVPPFESIKSDNYMEAFKKGMEEQKANIEKIISNNEAPSFDNTILALENSGELLDKTSNVFYNLKSANTNDEMEKISEELAPLMSSHFDDINLNEKLFAKVKAVYEKEDKSGLSIEQNTLLDKTYKNFIRGGVNLAGEAKSRFRDLNKELSLLYLKYSQNLLGENNRFKVIIDNKEELAGLPESSINAAAETAKNNGEEGKWMFTIHKPSLLPLLENSENRALREKMYKAYIMKCDQNDSLDNKGIINKIVNLRIERANLLGFDSHANFILDKNMAKEPKQVYELLDKIMPAAIRVAKQEVVDMQKIIDAEGGNFKLEPWDYAYYAAKVKQQKFALNENEIRPYLKLENVRDGMFWVANQLYGITFTKLSGMPVYHPDVEVFEVKEENGDHLGIFYADYYQRESKRSGAWCTSYREQKYEDGKRIAPIMSIVCNFTSPVGDVPALLTADEAQTLFHEFGHSLDGLFSNKQYASLGTPRDFVELPSQVMENWAFAPEVLNHYAKHYKTNEPMPNELIEKIKKSGKFNQGFATTEYLAAAYLDMDWHTLTEQGEFGVDEFEKKSMQKINLISEIVPRYRSTYFQHIFAGSSYSAGYYSYIWAAVLDADAFEAFKENGIFDKETASKFRNEVLALGGTQDAMVLYKNFRGAEPKIEPLLERKGLK